MNTHLKAATKFVPKSPQTQIKTTLQRHSISQSSIRKTQDRDFSHINTRNATSLSHNTNKISCAGLNFNVLTKKNKSQNFNRSFSCEQGRSQKIQASKIQKIGIELISNNYSRGDKKKSIRVSDSSIVQRQLTSRRSRARLTRRDFLRTFRNYNRNSTDRNFRRLYYFQRSKPHLIRNIASLRGRLVRDVAGLYDQINLNGAPISYSHSTFTHPVTGKKANATADPTEKTITVYKEGMEQEVNSFLNTVRHEGFHIAQFRARGRGQIPNLGNRTDNVALLEFLAEYREIVGGFEENLISYRTDVRRFVNNYEIISPGQFSRRWRNMILNRGVRAGNTLRRRIARESRTIRTLTDRERDILPILRRYRQRIIRKNRIFRN